MPALLRSLVAVAGLLASSAALAQDTEMAENPFYKFWSKSKPGDFVSLKETTKLSGPAAGGETGGEEVKLVTHKLVEVTPEKVVVETVVTEGETFGYVQSAPTKHIYPAKMRKQVLEDLIREIGGKGEEKTVKVGDKEIKVMYLTGTIKKGDEEIAHQIWLADEIPGKIAKRVRVTKFKGEVVAETTIEVVKFTKN
jgi:hypothetical protein